MFKEAAGLGVVQAHISGGEPLLRADLSGIVAAAREAGIYTQLVTSGVGLTAARLDELLGAGIESVRLSLQDARRPGSDLIAGRESYTAKRDAAAVIRAAGVPFGLNVVLHRGNLGDLDPPNVGDHPLDWIWEHSPAFNAYRGTAWMTGPCGECPRRETDFGGCRCQAHALTGDAARTDPACSLSPDHDLIRATTAEAERGPVPAFVYRRPAGRR